MCYLSGFFRPDIFLFLSMRLYFSSFILIEQMMDKVLVDISSSKYCLII
jgi:hypothetical protein